MKFSYEESLSRSLFRSLEKLPYFSCPKSLKQNAAKVVCFVLHMEKEEQRKHLGESDKLTYQILPVRWCECSRCPQCPSFSCSTVCSPVWLWRSSLVSECSRRLHMAAEEYSAGVNIHFTLKCVCIYVWI